MTEPRGPRRAHHQGDLGRRRDRPRRHRARSTSSTGVGFYDHMLDQLGRHGLFDLTVKTEGDLHIDSHHTIEDTALALGAAFKQALGDKRGICRSRNASVPLDESLAQVTVDLSGRPYLVHTEPEGMAPMIGALRHHDDPAHPGVLRRPGPDRAARPRAVRAQRAPHRGVPVQGAGPGAAVRQRARPARRRASRPRRAPCDRDRSCRSPADLRRALPARRGDLLLASRSCPRASSCCSASASALCLLAGDPAAGGVVMSDERKKVVVFDYGFGNVRSAERALARAGAEVEITRDYDAAMDADGLLVPGVGAFAACMEGLSEARGDWIIGRRLAGGRPVLGICVGMQILFARGIEHGVETEGLRRVARHGRAAEGRRSCPHMGWNTVEAPAGSAALRRARRRRPASTSCTPTPCTTGSCETRNAAMRRPDGHLGRARRAVRRRRGERRRCGRPSSTPRSPATPAPSC